jgi:hypothetical protein
MITLKVKPGLLKKRQPSESMNFASINSGVTYPTYRSIERGTWTPKTMRVLAAYLESIGYTADDLGAARIEDIFEVT